MKPETKYKGSIKLSAIGDALGWITEFEKTSDSLKTKFGTERIEQFFDWKKNVGGRFLGFTDHIKAGSYSDDTQLLLAVARSIKKDGTLDHEYFSKIELHNWLDYARGGGRTVKTAADKISRKSARWFSNFYNFKINGQNYDYRLSGANGAAMRVLPIALANLGNIDKIKEEIFCNSITTHGHPRAILGAMLYGYAINQIVIYRPEDFDWENYITQIGLDFPNKFELNFRDRIEIREWLKEWNKTNDGFDKLYAETIIETQNQLRFIYQSIKQNLSINETFKKLGCFDPATKGSGIATVVAGIYLAAKYHNNPLTAITEAVNALGSDTDSIAAFTGGLVGALHGHNIIPDKWKTVQDISYLDAIAEKLLAISEDRLPQENENKVIGLKVLNSPKHDDFNIGETVEFIPLGQGKINFIDRQPTLTKGKYNLIVQAIFDSGQSCLFSKLFSDPTLVADSSNESEYIHDLILLATDRLKPTTLEKFKTYMNKQKKMSKAQIEFIQTLLRNDS
jgi:ADP-ribosylglycohydrolase